MNLTSGASAVAPGITTYFLAQGGTAPFAYLVRPGGAGGTIDAASGLYTAPATVSDDPSMLFDTIQASDANGAVANAQILVGNPLQLVCDIIQNQLGLAQGQVYLYNQKINIPTDSNLYVAVGLMSCKPFGNVNRPDGSGSGLTSEQYVAMGATLSIDILSRSTVALNRKEEIIMALQSDYARTQQDANSFYVGKISTGFVNLSQDDGAAIPYRFNISVNVQYAVRKTQAVPYMSTFSTTGVTTQP